MKIREVKFIKSAPSWEFLPTDDKMEVAFIGRSNVGKSSLVNMLVGRKALAHTSNTPGKTQALNYYLVNDSFYLVDLPGYGYAKIGKAQRSKWAKLIERYLQTRQPLKAVLHLIDSRHKPTELDEAVVELMRGAPMLYLILLTKTDKLTQKDKHKALKNIETLLNTYHLEVPVILTAATKGIGKTEIWKWLWDVGIRD